MTAILPEFARTDDTVEFGKLFEQIALVALGQAAGGNQHPAGTRLLQLRPCSRIVLIDSCLASSMNPHVLMMTTSAFLDYRSARIRRQTSVPSMISEST